MPRKVVRFMQMNRSYFVQSSTDECIYILDCDLYTLSSELFKELNWQTFPERVTYQKAILMYRIINNICPDYLKNYVSYTSDKSCRHTRSTNYNHLYTPKPNCELFRKSCMYSGAAIWNYLPLG